MMEITVIFISCLIILVLSDDNNCIIDNCPCLRHNFHILVPGKTVSCCNTNNNPEGLTPFAHLGRMRPV